MPVFRALSFLNNHFVVIHSSSSSLCAAGQRPITSWTCLDKLRKVTGHERQSEGSFRVLVLSFNESLDICFVLSGST